MGLQASNAHRKRCLDYMPAATIKAVLVMTNTQAGDEAAKDSAKCSDFTLDAFDGSNGDPVTLTLTAAQDNTNNRGKVTQQDNKVEFDGITGGTRDIAGVAFVEWITDLPNSRFLGYAPFASQYETWGADLKVNCSTEGIYYNA